MIRHGLIGQDKDPGFMQVKVPPPKFYVPAVINENREIKHGESFLPDALLVNVISSQTEKPEHIFNYVHFPPNGTESKLREHLMYHKDKEYHISLSDFNLLAFLCRLIDVGLVCDV